MPYADPDKQREAQARWYREKYWREKAFREQEAERKALWLQTEEGKLSNGKASAWQRYLKKLSQQKVIDPLPLSGNKNGRGKPKRRARCRV